MGTEKILIVEAETGFADAIRDKLVAMGYPITDVARTSEEAIRKSEEIHPDLVLVDTVIQGKMDGYKVAEKIQMQYAIPVIYLTDDSNQSSIKNNLGTKPFGYLVKPVDDNDLSSAVETALFTC